MLELNKLYNMDCMQGMKEFPDGFFDLAIVDPPYGIGIDGQKKRVCGNPKHNRKEHIRKSWDKAIPPPEYFRELERVSKAQVIWGGNYFVPYLEQGHKGWLVWDKGQRPRKSEPENAAGRGQEIHAGRTAHPISTGQNGQLMW